MQAVSIMMILLAITLNQNVVMFKMSERIIFTLEYKQISYVYAIHYTYCSFSFFF